MSSWGNLINIKDSIIGGAQKNSFLEFIPGQNFFDSIQNQRGVESEKGAV